MADCRRCGTMSDSILDGSRRGDVGWLPAWRCCVSACQTVPPPPPRPAASAVPPPPPPPPPPRPPRIGLALGGGAARGFAHIGVIQVLEEAGIRPDLVVGTSAGSLVAALYAVGQERRRTGHAGARRWTSGASPTGRSRAAALIRGEALARYVREHTGGARDRADEAAAGHRRHRPRQRPADPVPASATRAWRCARRAPCRRCSSRCASATASTSTAAWCRRCRCALRARWAPNW